MQENETTFESVLANFAHRINLEHRQLCAFAMRYYRKILKKLNEKNLLTKLRAMLDITRLREMIDLANHLRFKSFKIIVLKQFLKLVNLTIVKENEKLAFVTNDLEKIRKNRCEILYA